MKFAINEYDRYGKQLTDLATLKATEREAAEDECKARCKALLLDGFHVQLVQVADRSKGAPVIGQADRWLATWRNRGDEVTLEASI